MDWIRPLWSDSTAADSSPDFQPFTGPFSVITRFLGNNVRDGLAQGDLHVRALIATGVLLKVGQTMGVRILPSSVRTRLKSVISKYGVRKGGIQKSSNDNKDDKLATSEKKNDFNLATENKPEDKISVSSLVNGPSNSTRQKGVNMTISFTHTTNHTNHEASINVDNVHGFLELDAVQRIIRHIIDMQHNPNHVSHVETDVHKQMLQTDHPHGQTMKEPYSSFMKASSTTDNVPHLIDWFDLPPAQCTRRQKKQRKSAIASLHPVSASQPVVDLTQTQPDLPTESISNVPTNDTATEASEQNAPSLVTENISLQPPTLCRQNAMQLDHIQSDAIGVHSDLMTTTSDASINQ